VPEAAEEDQEIEDGQISEADLQKVLAAVEAVEGNRFLATMSLARVVREVLGPTGTNHGHNGSIEKSEHLAVWLHDQGQDEYSAGYLRDLAVMADAFAHEEVFRCEEVGVSISVLYKLRYRPEKLTLLLDLLDGKRRREADGMKVPYHGQEVALATAIGKRGILSSDADALLHKLSAKPQVKRGKSHTEFSVSEGDSGDEESESEDLTVEQWIEMAKDDPGAAAEVLANRKDRSAVRRVINVAEHAASAPADPERVKENETIGGVAGMMLDWISASKAVDSIEEAEDFIGRMIDKINRDGSVDPDMAKIAKAIVAKLYQLSIKSDLLMAALSNGGFSDEDLAAFMKSQQQEGEENK
jgi:hypothetical protein